jgi:hypothetical protein
MPAASIEFADYGLYREGLMFALIVEDELFLNTVANYAAGLERAGSPRSSIRAGADPHMGRSCARTVHMQVAAAGKPVKGKRK